MVTEHGAKIELLENRYIAKKPYRCFFKDQEDIERWITELESTV